MKGNVRARDLKKFTRASKEVSVDVAGPKIGERPIARTSLSGVSFSGRSRITRAA